MIVVFSLGRCTLDELAEVIVLKLYIMTIFGSPCLQKINCRLLSYFMKCPCALWVDSMTLKFHISMLNVGIFSSITYSNQKKFLQFENFIEIRVLWITVLVCSNGYIFSLWKESHILLNLCKEGVCDPENIFFDSDILIENIFNVNVSTTSWVMYVLV